MNIRKWFSRMRRTTVEQAQQRAALAQGEWTYAVVMHDFYEKQAASLDPTNDVDHWAYAEAKQKLLDMRADKARLARVVDEWNAKLRAVQ